MARPRNSESDAAILTAASDTLLRLGYDGLVVDELARSVGVAKTTVYRRWPTKNHLVASVIAGWQADVAGSGSVSGSVSLVDDVTAAVVSMCRSLDPAPMRRLVAELAAASMRDAGLRTEVESLWSASRADLARLIERGLADGSLRPETDTAVLLDQLAGAVYHRVLITGDPLDDEFAHDVVASVLGGAR